MVGCTRCVQGLVLASLCARRSCVHVIIIHVWHALALMCLCLCSCSCLVCSSARLVRDGTCDRVAV